MLPFVRPDLSAFTRLDDLGLEVTGQRIGPNHAVLVWACVHGRKSLRADETDVAVSVVRPLGEGDDRELLLRHLVDHSIADVDALVLERAVEDDLVVPKLGNS